MTTKVVILNWNGSAHLRRFLPSVIASTPENVEIIVADNGSDDDSVEMLTQHFSGITVLALDRNYGYAEGYNRALAAIDSDYYILLNSDVEPAAGWIEPLVHLMNANRDVAAAAPKILSASSPSDFEYAGGSGGFIDFLGYPFCRGRILSTIEPDKGQYDDSREVFWASGACMMVRSRVFHELGGFDGRFFAHMEEIVFCWRAQLAGYRIIVEPQSTVYHLGGGTLPNNTPYKIYLNYRNNLAMLYKNLAPGRMPWIMLSRFLLDGASAAVFLLQGHVSFVKAVFKAHMDFYKWHKELRRQRHEIQDKATSQPRHIMGSSIILHHALGKRRFSDL